MNKTTHPNDPATKAEFPREKQVLNVTLLNGRGMICKQFFQQESLISLMRARGSYRLLR